MAGLALDPQNQNFVIRLEFLMHQLVVRIPEPSMPAASKGVIRNLLNELEYNHQQVCAYEDPVISYYISEYYFNERIYKFFRGIVESPHDQFRLFSECTESQDDYIKQILGFTPRAALQVILAVNTLIAERIKAPLYSPIPPKNSSPLIPASDELTSFMNALVIHINDIALSTLGVDEEIVRSVIEQIAGKQGEQYDQIAYDPEDHPILRRPCIKLGDSSYLITFPSLLFAAIRKVVYDVILQSEDAVSALDHDCRESTVRNVVHNLMNIHHVYDPVRVCVSPMIDNKQIADIAVFIDHDKIMLISMVIYVTP